MKLRQLSIRNCLSFNENGFIESKSIELGDFNLLIGSNNSGKSNVFKIMRLLTKVLVSIREHGNAELENFPMYQPQEIGKFDDWIYNQEVDKREIEFGFTLEIEETDKPIADIFKNYNAKTDYGNLLYFLFHLKQGFPKYITLQGFIKSIAGTPKITLTKVHIPNDHQDFNKYPILDKDTSMGYKLTQKSDRTVWKIANFGTTENKKKEQAGSNQTIRQFIILIYDQIFQDLFIEISAIRKIESTGDEIAEALSTLHDGRQSEKRIFGEVKKFIEDLTFYNDPISNDIDLSFPGDTHQKRIEIVRGDLILPLSHFGSSVEQMLVLAARIVQHGINKIVIIEEPEAHFHPELQKQFIRFLFHLNRRLNHQYLIATHSHILIDEFVKMKGNVYNLYSVLDKDNNHYSKVEWFDKDNASMLFRELGVKPSDMLFANAILIVEGPIDKDIITDWAQKIGRSFEQANVVVIDVEGAGNISKYLGSEVIRRTSLLNCCICDKNAENEVRVKLRGIVDDERIIALEKGDLEEYYPREIVSSFAEEWGKIKNKSEGEIPKEIKEGETVAKLNELLGGDWWKRKLADRVINETKPEQVDSEISEILSKIIDALI